MSPAKEAVTNVETLAVEAVKTTEHCPEALVVALEELRVPEVADHVIVLPATGEPLEVSVAVRVTDPPGLKVKLEGEIERVVEGIVTMLITPDEVPLLD